jgi:hypothetical protein
MSRSESDNRQAVDIWATRQQIAPIWLPSLRRCLAKQPYDRSRYARIGPYPLSPS